MPATDHEAEKLVFAQLLATARGSINTLLTYTPTIYWQGSEQDTGRIESQISLMVTNEVLDQVNAAVSPCEQLKRYSTESLLLIQVQGPRQDKSLQLCKRVSELMRDAFRCNLGAVWIRKARVTSIPPNSQSWESQVWVNYQYSTIA